MSYNSLFIKCDIPDRLSRQEMLVLFNRMKQGDMRAREEIINNNIGLVINVVLNNFMQFNCDKQELVAVGCERLIRAVDTFDISKGNEFSTYARKCIYNGIINFLRVLKKYGNDLSLDDFIVCDEDDVCIKLEDTIPSEEDIEEEYIRKVYGKIQLRLLQQSIEFLNDRNKEILMLYFGFYNNKRYTCKEIGEMMNISTAGISIAIKRSLNKLKDRMEELSASDNILKRSKNK